MNYNIEFPYKTRAYITYPLPRAAALNTRNFNNDSVDDHRLRERQSPMASQPSYKFGRRNPGFIAELEFFPSKYIYLAYEMVLIFRENALPTHWKHMYIAASSAKVE